MLFLLTCFLLAFFLGHGAQVTSPLNFRCSRGVAVRHFKCFQSAGAEPRGVCTIPKGAGSSTGPRATLLAHARFPFLVSRRGQEPCASANHICYSMRLSRRVVITGLGAVTPLGNSVPEFWSNVVS